MATPELSPVEVITAIAPLIGGGGLISGIVAYFAYRAEVAKGRRGDPDKQAGVQGITALLADSESITKLSISISQVALAADKVALLAEENREDLKEAIARAFKLGNDAIDEFRHLRRALEDLRKH